MKNKWSLILIIIIFTVAVTNADTEWDWRENLRKYNSVVKNTTERVRSGTQKAKENWKEKEKECSVCGKTIHIGTKCTSCQAKIAKDGAQKFGEKVKERTSDIKRGWDEGRGKRKEIYNSVKEKYSQTLNKIRDPEIRRKATETISAIIEIRRKIKKTKRDITNKGFNMLVQIPIDGTTLGEIASKKLSKEFPNLGKTGIFNSPTEAVTALVCHDSNFFLNEVNIIKKNGGNVSVYDAIRDSSSFDADKTIKYLQIAGATDGIASANDVGEVIIGVFNAIDAANK